MTLRNSLHRACLLRIAAAVVVGSALVAPNAGATEIDISDPVSAEQTHVVSDRTVGTLVARTAATPPTFSTTWSAGARFGGISHYVDDGYGRFAVAIDDRVEIFDEDGALIATLNDIPGALDPLIISRDIYVASSTGEIHQFDRESLELQKTIDTGDSGILSMTSGNFDIYYLTVDRPDLIGRIRFSYDDLDPELIQTAGPNRMVRASGSFVAAVNNSVSLYYPRAYEPASLVDEFGPFNDVSDVLFDQHAHTAWIAPAGGPTISEYSRFQESIVQRPNLAAEGFVAATRSSTLMAFATVGSEQWDIRVHDGSTTRPSMVVALESGDWVIERGLAIGFEAIAAVVMDATCGCPSLVLEPLEPGVDNAETVRSVEAGDTASLTISGTALDTSWVLDRTRGRVDAVANADGTTLTVDMSGHDIGRYTLEVTNATGIVKLLVDVVAPAPPPVDITATLCPWLTDSVVRLYSAYFLRAPEVGGFEFWLTEYSNGNWDLGRMAQFFAESPEFNERYGSLNDQAFVDLVYRNVLGRNPDTAGVGYWTERMSNHGLTRGELMLNFSESPEYVDLTATAQPLAGDFNWFPAGTTWACGFGVVNAAVPPVAHVDIAMFNLSSRDQHASISLETNGQWGQVTGAALPTGTLIAYWAVPYTDGSTTALRLESTGDFGWMLVFSPQPTPTSRAGWN